MIGHGHAVRRIVRGEDERTEDRAAVVGRLVRHLKPYWLPVLGAFVMILINAGTLAAGPFLISRAVDNFITAGDKRGLARTMLLLIGVYLVGMVTIRLQIYWISLAGQNMLADLRVKIFKKVERLSLQYVESEEAGDLMSRLVNDIDAINFFFSQGLAQALGALFALIGVVVAMISLNWQLALATLVVLPLMVLITAKFASMARNAFRQTRETIGYLSADLQEELDGVKVAKAFNRGDRNVRRFADRNAANRDANVSANAVTSAFTPVMDVLSTLDIAIVAGYGGYLAVQGTVSVGVVVAFMQYVRSFLLPIRLITQVWTLAQSAFAAAERVFDLLDEEVDIQDAPEAEALPLMDGHVRFDGVTFAYEHGLDVLDDIHLEAKPGQTVALVGPTGAGKTTLVSLIPRFYEVSQGSVRLDGYDVRDVTQASIREQIGMVLQEPFLFSGTVMENIRYGRLEATDEDVIEAAKLANAHDFITRLPDGYQTEVGERGGMLSQGQRQLVSIARTILADPRILILDEATASVDTRTEALIQEALEKLLGGRTSFVIAHRLSTVRNADMIFALDEGKIIERGDHQSLLAQDGLYADLYRRQFYVAPEQ